METVTMDATRFRNCFDSTGRRQRVALMVCSDRVHEGLTDVQTVSMVVFVTSMPVCMVTAVKRMAI